jgi:hypothetical protein
MNVPILLAIKAIELTVKRLFRTQLLRNFPTTYHQIIAEELNYNKNLLPIHDTRDDCPKKDAIKVHCHQISVSFFGGITIRNEKFTGLS